MDKSIRQILTMMEDMPMPGSTSMMSGGAMAQNAQEVGMDIMPGDYAPDGYEVEVDDEYPISSELLNLAQELVAKAGGADKAREVIDKVQDVQDILNTDDVVISGMADSIPDEPDLPNNRHDDLGMSSMFDPGHTHM